MYKNVLWLDSNFTFIAQIRERIKELSERNGLNLFLLDTPEELVKKIREFQITQSEDDYIIITGVQFFRVEKIVILPEFFKPKLSQPNWIDTPVDVGLILYQKLFLDNVEDNGVIHKNVLNPPPLIVLTADALDIPRHQETFSSIKRVSPLSTWINKFDFEIESLEEILGFKQ